LGKSAVRTEQVDAARGSRIAFERVQRTVSVFDKIEGDLPGEADRLDERANPFPRRRMLDRLKVDRSARAGAIGARIGGMRDQLAFASDAVSADFTAEHAALRDPERRRSAGGLQAL